MSGRTLVQCARPATQHLGRTGKESILGTAASSLRELPTPICLSRCTGVTPRVCLSPPRVALLAKQKEDESPACQELSLQTKRPSEVEASPPWVARAELKALEVSKGDLPLKRFGLGGLANFDPSKCPAQESLTPWDKVNFGHRASGWGGRSVARSLAVEAIP